MEEESSSPHWNDYDDVVEQIVTGPLQQASTVLSKENDAVARAVQLVRDLLEQLTANDAPAGNETEPTTAVVLQQRMDGDNNNNNCSSSVGGADVAVVKKSSSDRRSPANTASSGSTMRLDEDIPARTSSLDADTTDLCTTGTATTKAITPAANNDAPNHHPNTSSSGNRVHPVVDEDQATTAARCHLFATTTETAASIATGTTNTDATQRSVMKMGHGALVALCVSALQKVEGGCNTTTQTTTTAAQTTTAPTPDEMMPMIPLHIETTNRVATTVESSKTCTPAFLSSRGDKGSSPKKKGPKKKFALPWHRNRHAISVGSFPSLEDDDEEKKDEEDMAMPQQNSRRLQLFGSEYARHLSTSQLAPPVLLVAAANNANKSSTRKNSTNRRRSASTMLSQQRHHNRSFLLEEAPAEIQTGALLDIVVTCNDDPPPAGFYRISQTASGKPVAFGSNSCSSHLRMNMMVSNNNNNSYCCHLNVKKEAVWDKAAQRPCVTAVTLIFPDRQEFVPPGFSVVRINNSEGPPANLNHHQAAAERVYLCIRRSREGNPVTGILPLVPVHGEAIPGGFTVVERTPRNYSANVTAATGEPVFLAIRQRLANLEPLRPEPLVKTLFAVQQQQRVTLSAYYSTGGSVVESNIGRFHIMDRTTHSLLSPSSVSNRLNLIELSRRRKDHDDSGATTKKKYHQSNATIYARSVSDCGGGGESVASSHASLSGQEQIVQRRECCGGGGAAGSLADYPIDENTEVNDDFVSECSATSKDETNMPTASARTANLSSLLAPTGDEPQEDPSCISGEVAELQSCRAMSFIPEIETAMKNKESQLHRARLEVRTELLTPILTACYTHHGGAALLAVGGLTALLTDTDFFRDDVDISDESSDDGSSARITLLDLAIQAVCDVATSGSQEITFASCVDFVGRAVAFSQGQLNTRTIGFVVRFYLFVFYFDVSIPRKGSSKWPSLSWRPPTMNAEEDFPMLYDPRCEGLQENGYLSGGAAQAAALALKELISLSIVRLGKISVTDLLVNGKDFSPSDPQTPLSEGSALLKDAYAPLLDSILSSLVDNAVDHVDRANYTQLALHQIHRSGGSELFWHDMVHACGSGLFAKDETLSEAGRDVYIMIFAMLQQIVKVSSGKLRATSENVDLLPKDIASKLLSLELLLHFLEFWSDEQEAVNGMTTVNGSPENVRSIETLAFAVRRTVVPCLLWNTRAGLENPQVFRRVIRIVSELWCSPVYRKHCKAELGILIEHFALRILELGPQCLFQLRGNQGQASLLSQQVELIGEIKNWFSGDSKDVIELYLNYDTAIASEVTGRIQIMPGTRWQVFQRLCAGLSSIAEQCGELIGDQIRQNQSIILTQVDKSNSQKLDALSSRNEAKRDAAEKSEIREAARVLRKVSLEAIAQIVKDLAISSGAVSGKDYTTLLLSWSPTASPISYESSLSQSSTSNSSLSHEASDLLDKNSPQEPSASERGDAVLTYWQNFIVEDQRQRSAASVPSTKESLDTAVGIAQQKSLKKAVEYLIACNTLTPVPRDIANFLRIHKDRFDPATLGLYLSEGGTGGAESEYWNSIRYLFVRAISFIGMNVEEGLRHFLTTSGFRLPGEAQQIDRLMSTFAQCFFEDNAGDHQHCPFKDQDTVYLLVFAIIMLNTDLHKSESTARKSQKKMTKAEFTNNLRGATQSEGVPKEYLSGIYDSIEARPIAMHEALDATTAQESQSQSLNELIKNVRASDSLLRGLAVHDFKFATIADFMDSLDYSGQDALSDLTCSCVSKTWHQWYSVVNTCLETAHLDPQGMEPAVDILLYALAVTVCLNMKMERSAFLGQLVRLRAFEERRQGRWVSAPDNSHREEQWYLELEDACSGLDERKLWALRQIHGWVQSLKAALRVDVRNKVDMTEAVAELINGDFLLHDPARAFFQSGNLIKKSGRTGRSTMYRFYLFSDVLLYASKEGDGRFKIHEELPLHLMKIVDWFPPSQKNRKIMFEVHHPRKTFRVICLSNDARRSWVENIRASILVEMERKMSNEAARLSVMSSTPNKK